MDGEVITLARKRMKDCLRKEAENDFEDGVLLYSWGEEMPLQVVYDKLRQ